MHGSGSRQEECGARPQQLLVPQYRKFVQKLRDVVGLYVDPPARAIVLSVDEKRSHGGGWRPTLQQGEIATRLTLEATHAKLSLIDSKRRPLSALTLARFCLVGNQSINLAGYIVVAGRRDSLKVLNEHRNDPHELPVPRRIG